MLKLFKFDTSNKEVDVVQICLKHLKQDLVLLSTSLGRNLEEASLVIHIILKDMIFKVDSFQGKNKVYYIQKQVALLCVYGV